MTHNDSLIPNQLFVRSKKTTWILIVAAGLMNIAIFPRLDLPWLSLFCFLPLFLLIPGNSRGRLFRYFFLAGFLFRIGNLYWIYFVIEHYSEVPPPVVAGIVLLLCLFLASFWGIFGWFLGFLNSRIGFEKAMVVAPFLWILLERLINLLQFPWDLAGTCLFRQTAIAQIASLFGVYGLSWLVLAVNAAFATFVILQRYYYNGTLAVLAVLVSLYGHWQTSRPLEGPEIRVGVVQASIPQDVKINYDFAEEVNRKHIRMTEELLDSGPADIVFWPESSTMYPFLLGGAWAEQVRDLARSRDVPILIGTDAYVDKKVLNSSFLIDPRGEVVAQYSKIYLVPFGEFVPFNSILFFAGKVVPEISDFTAGESYTQFPVKGKTFAVNICFEVVFPQLARTLCRDGASLLVTVTNDAWFGKTCAPYQHFAMAAMRSIENRRYLVRAANTGISGVVDPYGRILQETPIFVPAKFLATVRFIEEKTFYTKHGDLLLYFSFFVVFVSLWLKKK